MEFVIMDVENFLKSHGVLHFVCHSEQKAAVVERFNRTLKTRIYTNFTAEQTNIYIDKLEDFVKSYKHSVHRMIGRGQLMLQKRIRIEYGLGCMGTICIGLESLQQLEKWLELLKKLLFEKGYMPKWSEQHFS